MWRPWAKSTVKVHGPSHRFSCPSFKDIQLLCSPSPDVGPSSSSASSSYQWQHSIFLPPLSASASPNSLLLRSDSDPPSLPKPDPGTNTASAPHRSPGIVVYYTSLRVVRPTFEACMAVQSILQGFRVKIDERDLSMDPTFSTELQGVLGKGKLTLLRVFICGRHIGGAEEVKQLHEVGELKKLPRPLQDRSRAAPFELPLQWEWELRRNFQVLDILEGMKCGFPSRNHQWRRRGHRNEGEADGDRGRTDGNRG